MKDFNNIQAPSKENSDVHDIDDAKKEDYTVSLLLKKIADDCTGCQTGGHDDEDNRSVPTIVVFKQVHGTKSPFMIDENSTMSCGPEAVRKKTNTEETNVEETLIEETDGSTIPSQNLFKESDEKISFMLKKIMNENSCRCAAFDCHDDDILDMEIGNSVADDEEYSDTELGIEIDREYYRGNMGSPKNKYQRMFERLHLDKNIQSLKKSRPWTPKRERTSQPKKKERSRTPKREQRPSLKLATSRTLTKERSMTTRNERPSSPVSNVSSKTEEVFSMSSKRLQKRLEKIYNREQKIQALDQKLSQLKKMVLNTKIKDDSETDVSDDALSVRTGLEVVRLEV